LPLGRPSCAEINLDNNQFSPFNDSQSLTGEKYKPFGMIFDSFSFKNGTSKNQRWSLNINQLANNYITM
jgi:hypothetical protein